MHKLFIAGSGIKFLSHMTNEVQSLIRQSDCVVYLLNDPAMKRWISENSKKSLSLDSIYFSHTDREIVYDLLCDEVLSISIQYQNCCFITYGHPYYLSNVSEKILAKSEDNSLPLSIQILPGISSFDAMLCDLRIDPVIGCQTYESTDFALNHYLVNPNCHLILWQVGVIGITTVIHSEEELSIDKKRFDMLIQLKQKLLGIYDKKKQIVLYVASMYPNLPFQQIKVPIEILETINIPRLATAYISPN